MRNQRSGTRNDKKSRVLPATFQGHSTNVTPTEEAMGWTRSVPETIPKGEMLNSGKKSPKEHYFSEYFLNPKIFWKCHSISTIPGGLKSLAAHDRSPTPSQPWPALGGTRTEQHKTRTERNCFNWAQKKPPKAKIPLFKWENTAGSHGKELSKCSTWVVPQFLELQLHLPGKWKFILQPAMQTATSSFQENIGKVIAHNCSLCRHYKVC